MILAYLIGGILLYILIVLDIFQTTLSMQGGGWFTSRFSHFFWKILLKVSGRKGSSKILSHAGYFLLISILFIWATSLWISFSLLLHSDPISVVNSATNIPADSWEKIYFAGFTLSTLGVGDYIANSDFWRIITNIYSYTGLILLTMSVTYFIPALSAVIAQRKMGIRLRNLGESPQDILLNSWNGKDFSQFIEKVNDLSESIVEHSQNHRAYPVIHYFHNWKMKNAAILQLARLYEALYLFKYFVHNDYKPDDQDLWPLEVAFENYFEVITEVTHIKVEDELPPQPKTSALATKGLLLSDLRIESASSQLKNNRRIINTLIKQDGWSWDMV